MRVSTRSIRLGAILAFLLMGMVAGQYEKFVSHNDFTGLLYFAGSLAGCLFLWMGVAVGWDKPKFPRAVWMVWVFFMTPLAMIIVVERLGGHFITTFLHPDEDILENYVVTLLLYLLVFGLTGSFRASMISVTPVLLLFGVANMYVKEFKGSPLVPMDFGSIRTAANVAAGYTYEIGFEIIFGVCVTAAIIGASCRLRMSKWPLPLKIILRGLCLLVVCGFAWTFYFTDVVADHGLKPDFFNQTRGYANHGAILEFTLNTKYLRLREPGGYDPDRIEEIVEDRVEQGSPHILETALIRQGTDPAEARAAVEIETAGARNETPNVIVIMNESYSDLRVVGDIETNAPFMPFVDSLKENTIQGNAYVSVIGTGTSNTEYEFLTGNSMAFLPAGSNAYQLYVGDSQPSLVATLMARRYSATAFHPYYRSSWNREAVYDSMGFEDFITIENMIDQDILDRYKASGYSYKQYKRMLSARYPGENIILRRYVSDAYDFEYLEDLYEHRNRRQPFFLFNVTMQSHSSYNQVFDNFDQQIELTGLKGNYPKTDQYLSLIKATDEAFEDLLEYFSRVEEPTVILMFGDHQPFIEDSFYAEVLGAPVSKLDDETQQQRYITRFILWANYDIPEGWIDEISVNYLSTLLLQVTGLDMPDYNRYLASVYTELPVITAMGCRDSEGNFFQADQRSPKENLIRDYRCVAYNNLSGGQHREDSVFYLED